MAGVFKKALQLLIGTDNQQAGLSFSRIDSKNRPLESFTREELIRLESEIGAELFGPIPDGHKRSFYNLDPKTWVWYEEWSDADNKSKRRVTTRYEVQPNGVLKVQDGSSYTYLSGQEFDDFTLAVQMYYEQVMRKIYKRDPNSGQKLA